MSMILALLEPPEREKPQHNNVTNFLLVLAIICAPMAVCLLLLGAFLRFTLGDKD